MPGHRTRRADCIYDNVPPPTQLSTNLANVVAIVLGEPIRDDIETAVERVDLARIV